MSSTFVQVAGGVGRKVLIATILGLIGLVVGIGCVLLPPVAPFGVVGIAAVLLLLVMPEMRSVPDRWARGMVSVVVFVFTCVPVYFAIILPGLPWISFRRAALILWLVPLFIVIAGSAQARRRVGDVLRASPWLTACTLGFIAITLATLPTAVYLSSSLNYVGQSFLLSFLPLLGVIICVRDENAVITIFKVSAYAIAIDFVLGVMEFYLQRPFLIYALPGYMRQQIFMANPILQANLVQGMGIRAGSYRASSIFTTALSWGENCAMVIPITLHFVAHGRTARAKAAGLAGALICFVSISLSGSRGAFVSMIAAVVCYSMCWSFRSNLLNKGSLAGKIGLTFYAMGSVATLLAVLFVGRVHRAVLGGGEGQLSTESRYVEWALAKPKILARPIQGYGGGSAGEVIHYISMLGAPTVDGYYMNLLVDYGIPGFLLFFAAFLLAAATCFKTYLISNTSFSALGNALGSSIIAFTTYRTTLSQNDSLTFAFMLIGLTLVYSYEVRRASIEAHQTEEHRPSRVRGSMSL